MSDGDLARTGMDTILGYLARHGSYLWQQSRYRIVECRVAPGMGRPATVVVASDRMRLEFSSERGELFMELGGLWPEAQKHDVSPGIAYCYVTGEEWPEGRTWHDPEFAAFMAAHLEQVEDMFADEVRFHVDVLPAVRQIKQRWRDQRGG